MVGDSVVEKLRKRKVNEVSLLSVVEGGDRQLAFLEQSEREKLVARLREYCLRKAVGGVEYSRGLTLFFIGQKADHILEKLRQGRVRESTLLKLHSRQAVRDLAFLSEQEREVLPKLVKQFSEEQDFTALMASVHQYLQQPAKEE
jgi:folate-binding Fe-S cluster repair protein YgfZ